MYSDILQTEKKCKSLLYKSAIKFKGGNYLLWLEEIVYAEDKDYIMSIVNVERIIKKAHKSMFLNKFICFSISIPKFGISADAILWYSII